MAVRSSQLRGLALPAATQRASHEALRDALVRRARRLVSGAPGRQRGLDADDLAQATFTKLFDAYPDFGSWAPDKQYGFAFVALHRTFLDGLKRRRAELTHDGSLEPVSEGPWADDALDRARLGAVLTACLDELRDEARRFLLSCFALDSAPAAQEEVSWPPGGSANACHTRRRLVVSINDCVRRRGGE